MSGSDLVSLGVIVLSAHEAEHDLIRQGAGLAAVPVDLFMARHAAEVMGRLAPAGVDLLLLGSGVPDLDKQTIVRSARARPRPPFVVAVAAEPPALGEGVVLDGALPIPDVAAARAMLDRCVKARLPKRVLVVDDSATTRRVVRKILAASRFHIESDEAEEGTKALRAVESGRFDLVFLDYRMPGLNGAETLAQIRREHPGVAVVMMTASEDPAAVACAREAGAAFLKKPFYPADIDVVLNRFYGFGSLKPQA